MDDVILALIRQVKALQGESDRRLASERGAVRCVHKTANQSFSSETLADVADLAFPVAANLDYGYWFVVVYASDTPTTGIQLGVSGPGAAAEVTYEVEVAETTVYGTDAIGAGGATGPGVGVSASSSGAPTRKMARVWGVWRNGGTSGTVKLQAAREVGAGAGTVTIYRGSFCWWSVG